MENRVTIENKISKSIDTTEYICLVFCSVIFKVDIYVMIRGVQLTF